MNLIVEGFIYELLLYTEEQFFFKKDRYPFLIIRIETIISFEFSIYKFYHILIQDRYWSMHYIVDIYNWNFK